MLFRTHFVFGIFIYLLLVNFIDNFVLFFIGLMIGVIIVDLDSRSSKFGKNWYFRPLQLFVSHRGIMHSLFFGFVVMVLLAIFNVILAVGFFIGFLSHIFLDCFTKQGVNIFWPFFNGKIKGFVRSGAVVEDVIFVLFLLVDIFLFVVICFNHL